MDYSRREAFIEFYYSIRILLGDGPWKNRQVVIQVTKKEVYSCFVLMNVLMCKIIRFVICPLGYTDSYVCTRNSGVREMIYGSSKLGKVVLDPSQATHD